MLRCRDNFDGSKAAGEDGGAEDVTSDEQKELIARELNFFRERAALKEKERKEEEGRLERMSSRSGHHHRQSKDSLSAATGANASTSISHRAGRERAWGRSSSSGAGGSSRQMDFVSASSADGSSSHSPALASTSSTGTTKWTSGSQDHDTGMDSEEEEKVRQERRERELEHTFKERKRRLEHREVERMRSPSLMLAESHAARDAMDARFAQWNDDVERERRHEDYYRDRSRWWHRRQAFLVKGQRYDELDREEEKEELAGAAKKAAQEAEAALSAAAAAVAEISSTAMDIDPAIASALAEAGQDKDVEMNETSGSGSISTNDISTDATAENDKNDGTASATGLDIPSDPQDLWNWPIQWSYVDENEGQQLSKENILPFANKIVVELLGVPEETLTKYLVDHIRQKKPPQDLVSELRGALDNDADVLVTKVWKLLIQETESSARKQNQ
ncbi:hypothetical protein EC991_003540 [Linnemannia zychae]|nr:hypothetical protein EC991_003540 [Linnemannia zychae]